MNHTDEAPRGETAAAEQQTDDQTETSGQSPELEKQAQDDGHAGEQEQGEAPSQAAAAEESGSGRLEELEQEVKRLQALADENHQRFLRAQADFDNYRKRTLREREEQAKYASMHLVEQLLPVLDNFERALAAAEGNKDAEAMHKGVEMIYRQFFQVLEQEGLKPIPAVGEPFNPEIHQAVMQVESEEHGEGIVVEELQKGYFIKDKVLRPTMVKVSS